LLLEGVRASRWPQGSTQCGAGYESELVWLKLDRELAVVARQAVPIGSCWKSIDTGTRRLGSHALTIETTTLRGATPVTTRIRYDSRRPAEGLSTEDVPSGTR
jgi:hypothetical protein